MTLGTWHFLICEKVLQFHRFLHPDGLKSVAGPPMPQQNVGSNPFGIKILASGPAFGKLMFAPLGQSPPDLDAVVRDFPRPGAEIQCKRIGFESGGLLGNEMHEARPIAEDTALGRWGRCDFLHRNCHRALGGQPESLNQFITSAYVQADQLQLNAASLKRDWQLVKWSRGRRVEG